MFFKRILFITICALFVNINVDAACNSSRLKELREVAQKIEFSYDYTTKKESNLDEGDYLIVDFKITAVNLDERIKPLIIYDYYMDDYREFKYNKNKQSSLSGFGSGERVNVTFKAYTADDCAGETVFTKAIVLPYYNSFFNSEDCINNPGFKYCQSELQSSLVSNRQFYNELEKYLSVENNDDNEVVNDKKDNTFNINEVIGFGIIITIILVFIILIILKIKKERKRRGL